MHEIKIQQIGHQSTWNLRQGVLYPELSLDEMGMEEDLSGIHFGAYCEDDLVAVISLFNEEHNCQFRKFAVHPSMQGKGVGKLLLDYITGYAVNNGAVLLWCNARISAIGFYVKSGFKHTGKFFVKNGYEYEILEKTLQY